MAGRTVQFAVLTLISSRDKGIHGYQLKTDFEDAFGDFWAVNFGKMYRTLDHLERNGLISGAEVPQVGRPPRKVYRITDRGRKTLQDWFVLPPNDGRRPLRDDLAIKLLFRADERPTDILDLVRKHRSLYLQHLSHLNRRRARLEKTNADSTGTRLVLLQADMRVRSDLAWLEIVEKEIRKQLSSNSRSPSASPPRK